MPRRRSPHARLLSTLAVGTCLGVTAASGVSRAAEAGSIKGLGGDPSLAFTAGGHAAIIAIQIHNGHIRMRGTINGADSVEAMLDSGAGTDCIRATRADSLALAIARHGHAQGAGGSVETGVTDPISVGLPGLELARDALSVLPLDEIGAQTGRALDVILGYPLLSRAVVAIDYAADTLRVYDPAGWEYHGGGTIVPLTFVNHTPYVTARITIPGRKPITGQFVIDTGSAGTLALTPEFVEKRHVLDAIDHTVDIMSRGVGGASVNPMGRVERFELGGFVLEKPIAGFRRPGPGRISAPGTIGNIGGQVLKRFTVIFDYPRSRMILEPNAHLGEPFELDMSGLGLKTSGPKYERMTVGYIIPGSPAAEAGLREGDELTQVDGHRVAEIGLDALREMFRREGDEHRLSLTRDGAPLEVAIRTRRLI